MSAKKDFDALLRCVQQQGAEVTFTRSSHRRVTYKGQTTIVSASPSKGGGLQKVKADLRRMGLKV